MVSDENISFHSYSYTDFKKLVRLTKTTYDGREISSEEFLKWEYENNPEGKAIINVAEKDDEIVSQYIVLPKKFSIDNKIIYGSLSVNTLTHPDFRKKGLFIKLAQQVFERCAEEKIHFTIGFPNPVSHPVIKKFGLFNTTGSVPLLIYPVSPFKSLTKYLSLNREKSGEEIFLNLSKESLEKYPGIDIFNFENDRDKYDAFIHKFNRKKSIVKHRSLEYLKWRFLEIPLRKYFLLKAESGNEIRALLVMRAKHVFGLRCLILVDVISTGKLIMEQNPLY